MGASGHTQTKVEVAEKIEQMKTQMAVGHIPRPASKTQTDENDGRSHLFKLQDISDGVHVGVDFVAHVTALVEHLQKMLRTTHDLTSIREFFLPIGIQPGGPVESATPNTCIARKKEKASDFTSCFNAAVASAAADGIQQLTSEAGPSTTAQDAGREEFQKFTFLGVPPTSKGDNLT